MRRLINRLLDLADLAAAHHKPHVAEQLRALARRLECRNFGCPPPTGAVTISMDPALAAGFMSMPWPEDTRRHRGTIDLRGYPGRDASPVFDLQLARGELVTTGFGTNSPVYLQTTDLIDPTSLPSAEGSVGRRSPTMLLDLDAPSAPPVPLLVNFQPVATRLRPANLLALLPYPGHPLTEGHRYAALVFDGLLDQAGHALAPSQLLKQLDGPPPSGLRAGRWAKLRAERDDAIRAVRSRTLWHPSELVGFTVFTTQRITPELRAIAAAVRSLPTPKPVGRITGDCSTGAPQTVVSGHLDLPMWQAGPFPYLSGGGAIVIGPDGRAVRQGTARVVFDMAVPCAPAPAKGWPILLFMDGTGGFAHASNIGQLGDGPLPYVVLSIAPLYSGDRTVPAAGLPPEFLFFNFLNPLAGRTNQLQQAADMLYLERIAQNIELRAREGVDGTIPPRIDDATVVVVGHSQGALTLPLTLAADPSIDAAFISSGGGGLYHSLLHRGDVRAIVESLTPAQPGELDMFHPTVQAVQTIAEIGDPANYAPLVRSADIALYAGWIDGCSPIESNVDLASALGVPIANPVATPVFGAARFEPATVPLPVSSNLARDRTGVMVELDQGHFGASINPNIGLSLVRSIAEGHDVTVDPGPLPPGFPDPGCDGRADPPPG